MVNCSIFKFKNKWNLENGQWKINYYMTSGNILKKSNIYYIAIAALTVIPLVLGVFLISDLFWQKKTGNTAPEKQLIEPRVSAWKVTGDVLQAPPENAPADQVKAYVALVYSKAKETGTVSLTDCQPDPVVTKVPKSGTIIIENKDTVDHMLVFGPDETFTIPKNGKSEIAVPFPKGIQIVGYGCDGSNKGVGRFVLP